MTAKELRNKTVEELIATYRKTAEAVFNKRFQTEIEQIGNPSELRELKRDIARIKTILKEKGVKI
ncbi:MAG: 50S ribosomal protein L29 [Planctomycetota bacterium]|jgi:large subunit ribosomal protein L29